MVSNQEYDTKIEQFREVLSTSLSKKVFIHTGRKYDKLYHIIGDFRICLYVIDKQTNKIYGCKSWAMINTRRNYGSLDSITEWDWSQKKAVPLPNTPSFAEHEQLENEYKLNYKKRGRPRKTIKTVP